MGGKKKTKWRKVPPEELSHITVKRNSDRRTLLRDPGQTEDRSSRRLEYSRGPSPPGDEDDGYRNQPDPPLAETAVNLESEAYLPTAEFEKYEPQPGFYVNGLWLPTPETENDASNIANFPGKIIRPVPLFVHLPSAYLPTSYPSYSPFHYADVSINPNASALPSNLHFYCNSEAEVECSKESRSNESFKTSNSFNFANSEDSFRPDCYSLPMNDTLVATVKAVSQANKMNDSGFQYICLREKGDHESLSNVSCEVPDDTLPMYQYPEYPFGQALYGVPLYPTLPTAYPAQVLLPWPAPHIQRRRKRRRGYAEYAIIPQKKNTTFPNANVKNTTVKEDKRCSEAFLGQKQINSNESASAPDESQQEKNSEEISDKHQHCGGKQVFNSISNDLFSYTTALVENILLEAKAEFEHNNHFQENPELSNDNLDISNPKSFFPDMEKRVEQEEILQSHKNGTYSGKELPKIHVKPNVPTHKDNDASFDISPRLYLTDEKNLKISDKDDPLKYTVNHELCDSKNDRNRSIIKKDKENKKSNEEVLSEEIEILRTNPDEVNISEQSLTEVSNVQESHNSSLQYPTDGLTKKYLDENHFSKDLSNDARNKYKVLCPDKFNGTENSSRHLCSDDAQINVDEKPFDLERRRDEKCISIASKNVTDSELERQTTNNSISPHCSYMSHMMSSEALIREAELELNKLHQLTSKSALQKQSIYKLAYDENITDQSETEDQEEHIESAHHQKAGLGPHQPATNCGSRSEILVHEADSASDAGSEDVELLPHRYESESAQHCSKHIYVNNLSLAVELLRTRERLPYDDEFKRIVGEDNEQNSEPVSKKASKAASQNNHVKGTVNPAFVSDNGYDTKVISYLQNRNHIIKNDSMLSGSINDTIADSRTWRNSIADSGVQSEDSGDEVGEEAKETSLGEVEVHLNPDEKTKVKYRRTAQVRQQFQILAPRTGIVNPCLCCIVI